jgi:hypothetical protein
LLTICEIFHKYIEVKFRKLYIEIEEVSEIFHKLLRKIKVKKQTKEMVEDGMAERSKNGGCLGGS